MNEKPTVTVGISAYNEEANIKSLLISILAQKQDGFRLQEVVVFSDGSTDRTNEIVKKIKDRRIKLFSDYKRKGKALRLNEIFKQVNSDIIVLFDADIVLSSTEVVKLLIEPMLRDKEVMLTSGKQTPLVPSTFVQKVIRIRVNLWSEAKRKAKNTEMYFSSGATRAMRKKLYKEIKFPSASSEDVYPYLYCVTKSYKFKYAIKSEVFYGLPSSYFDYVSQMRRYLKSASRYKTIFGERVVREHYTITLRIKFQILLGKILRDPFWTSMYMLFLTPAKVIAFFDRGKSKAVWEIATSTKRLSNRELK